MSMDIDHGTEYEVRVTRGCSRTVTYTTWLCVWDVVIMALLARNYGVTPTRSSCQAPIKVA